MLDEDVIIKHINNNNERVLLFNILCVVVLPAIFFGGASEFFTGVFISLGIVAPVNTLNYIAGNAQNRLRQTALFAAATAPFLAALTITAIGLFNNSFELCAAGETQFFTMRAPENALPSAFSPDPLASLSPDLVSLAAFFAGFSLFTIAHSRLVIAKILLLCASAVALCMLLGCTAMFLWNVQTEVSDARQFGYFSTFPDAAQWAAFAVIWFGTALAVAVYYPQCFRISTFARSPRLFALVSAGVLLGGILCAGRPVHKLAAFAIGAFAFAVLAYQTMPIQRNARRHDLLRHISSHAKRLKKMTPVFALYAAIFLAFAAVTAGSCAKIAQEPARIFVDSSNANSITLDERRALFDDARGMLDKKHILFGYGSGSFPYAFSLFQGGDLGATPWRTPNSDLLQKLVENGIVGLALSCSAFLLMFTRWLFRPRLSGAGAVLLLATAATLAISPIESPLQCTAVLASFWIVSMAFFKWEDAATV